MTCVLVGEYICSEKEERPKFYVRNRMECERHIAELTAEGSDALQRMYRMEYSAFLKLSTFIWPKIQVNDEMSRCFASRSPITIEIMLHCLLQWLGGGSYLNIGICAGIFPAAYSSAMMQFELCRIRT